MMSSTDENPPANMVNSNEKSQAYEGGVTAMPALDVESPGAFLEVRELRQGLYQRHIQMIALAGTIGTGLFLSSGRAISQSGPLGAFIGYLVMGLTSYSVVLAVAEMGALVPLNGGIVRYAEYFVDPALSFANGWNLIYSYFVSTPAG
jgi:amino acid transporter